MGSEAVQCNAIYKMRAQLEHMYRVRYSLARRIDSGHNFRRYEVLILSLEMRVMHMEIDGECADLRCGTIPVNLPDFLKAAASYRNGGKDSEVIYSSHCPADEFLIGFQLYHSTDGE